MVTEMLIDHQRDVHASARSRKTQRLQYRCSLQKKGLCCSQAFANLLASSSLESMSKSAKQGWLLPGGPWRLLWASLVAIWNGVHRCKPVCLYFSAFCCSCFACRDNLREEFANREYTCLHERNVTKRTCVPGRFSRPLSLHKTRNHNA